ncbi:OmpA family protein [Roseovarius sp. 2305UL8-3]|uniref:OmpA family protein n=1 Tax=Roseovarius conchicola TaxID=3121636 RepID=UPI003529A3EB
MAALVFGSLPLTALADVEGSSDHIVTGRFEGSEINGYDYQEFDTFTVGDANGVRQIEGIVTQIAYVMPDGVSLAAASRNFEKRLQEQGYSEVFACDSKVDKKLCSRDLSYTIKRLPAPRMVVDSFTFTYSLWQSPVPSQITISLLTSQNNGRTYLQASIIEAEELSFQMVDARQISDGLSTEGRIALYGIQFDTDSAVIKPESGETLAELVTFLQGAPEAEILVVGHTDNQGSLEYNVDLSKRRAKAVRAHLVENGVDGGRLLADGVGFLAPVAPNLTAEGRALNRRVEIVPR